MECCQAHIPQHLKILSRKNCDLANVNGQKPACGESRFFVGQFLIIILGGIEFYELIFNKEVQQLYLV